MRTTGNMVCHIPARKGSKRVPNKNLRYIAGKPLIVYAIECARKAGVFNDIYVNSDSSKLCALAEHYGVKSFHRAAWLASDQAKGDDFTADFIEKIQPDTLVMINPVCPLITAEDVQTAFAAYSASECDTLISCEQTQMQAFCNGTAVNIDAEGALEPTQNNPVVSVLNWAVTIWDAKVFIDTYRKSNKGYLGTNRILFPLSPYKGIKISSEEDFKLAEYLLQMRNVDNGRYRGPRYWDMQQGDEKLSEPLLSIVRT